MVVVSTKAENPSLIKEEMNIPKEKPTMTE